MDIAGENIGVIVDAVNEVMRIAENTIEEASELVTTEHSYYMEGIAKLGDKLLILLDLNRVLSQEEASVAHQKVEAAASVVHQETEAAAP